MFSRFHEVIKTIAQESKEPYLFFDAAGLQHPRTNSGLTNSSKQVNTSKIWSLGPWSLWQMLHGFLMQQRLRNHEAKSGSELVLLISFYAENGRRNSRCKRRARGIEKDTLYYAAASTRPVSCCEFTVIRTRPIRSSCWGNSNSDRQSSAAAKRIYLQQTANWPSVSLVWWTSCCAQCVQLVAREQLFLFLYWLGPKKSSWTGEKLCMYVASGCRRDHLANCPLQLFWSFGCVDTCGGELWDAANRCACSSSLLCASSSSYPLY